MRKLLATTAILMGLGGTAMAQSQGEWMFGIGAAAVQPRGGSSNTKAGDISVKNGYRPTLTAEYFFMDNVGVELLAAWPFEHSVHLGGAGKIARVKHLPPTLTLHYYFTNSTNLTPFLGAGLNYTMFFDEKETGALKGADLHLKDSFGYAFHAGINYDFDDKNSIRADIRYIDIDTKAKVNGNKIGKVHIDPLIFGVSYLRRF